MSLQKAKTLLYILFVIQSLALAVEVGLLVNNPTNGFFWATFVFVLAMWIYTLWTLMKVRSY